MQSYGGVRLPAEIERLQAQYNNQKDEQSGWTLWQALERLGAFLQENQDYPGAKAVYLRCCELASELAETYGTDAAVRRLGISYDYLGTVFEAMDSFPEAKTCFERAKSQFEQFVCAGQGRATRGDIRAYAGCLTKLGKVWLDQDSFSEAQKFYQDGMSLRRDLFLESGQPADQLNLAFSYQCLGELAEKRRRPVQASLYYRQAAELLRQTLEQAKVSDSGTKELPLSEEMLLDIFAGDLLKAILPMPDRQNYAQAREYGERGIPLLRRLAALTRDPADIHRFSVLLEYVGNLCREEGDLNQAAICYKECLELRKRLIEEVGETPELLDDLALIYYNIALKETGNNRRLLLDRAEKLWSQLSRQYPDRPLYRERLLMCRRWQEGGTE